MRYLLLLGTAIATAIPSDQFTFKFPSTNQPKKQTEQTLWDLLNEDPDLGIFTALIAERPQMVEKLSDPNLSHKITLFAPENSAFDNIKNPPPPEIVTDVMMSNVDLALSCMFSNGHN